ncbi:MoxR-like ATPase [Marinitoga hydrogenitolerans DSM 16785]|uniref:MoxR-like ATPase n=1 Tax=Marinitoga hydrogenitolerans (strain DSM 16785 / JCM 12826 / AT1271) TaxID=1122195 RepID=A0A1M4S6K9_MARH1|nr:MoxR family ATPase [Marinitoga hydrogenitolerans]SHE27832.1 MoxR-like ATPase [Marinitoga hydrogenitolerans DSM 16785]
MLTAELSQKIIKNVGKVIKGKEEQIKMVLSVFFSNGHVLLEDVPGTGKTMLARALAKSFDLNFKRVQFTPDLLPNDLIGLYIYDKNKNEFVLKKGPIFTNILLGDEINRATPRTQSALLESLAESQVTIDGITHKLSQSFFVIATQNPIEFEGTFPLPEAQLDRFMIRLSLGYPDIENEIKMLDSQEKVHPINNINSISNIDEIMEVKKEIKGIHVSDEIKRYIVDIINRTRNHKDIKVGASPRGSISLMQLSKSMAAIEGREFVIPDDVKKIAPYVLAHRIILKAEAKIKKVSTYKLVNEILEEVKVIK